MKKLIIRKGQKFKTKYKEDYHGNAILTVKKVNGQSDDDWAVLEASPKIKYKRRWNRFKVRLWWLREFCDLIDENYEVI